MVRKRKTHGNEFIDVLFELMGIFWQLGAVATACFMIFALLSFRWINHGIAVAKSLPLLAPLAATYGWVLFSLPTLFLFLAFIFGKQALGVYLKNDKY